MTDPRDIRDIVEIGGQRLEPGGGDGSDKPSPTRRPWLAIRWTCCGAYSRVYRPRESRRYVGQCPRCGRAVRIEVGEGGTACRFFEAGQA